MEACSVAQGRCMNRGGRQAHLRDSRRARDKAICATQLRAINICMRAFLLKKKPQLRRYSS